MPWHGVHDSRAALGAACQPQWLLKRASGEGSPSRRELPRALRASLRCAEEASGPEESLKVLSAFRVVEDLNDTAKKRVPYAGHNLL